MTQWDSKRLYRCGRGDSSRNREEKMELRTIKEEIINGGWLFVEEHVEVFGLASWMTEVPHSEMANIG